MTRFRRPYFHPLSHTGKGAMTNVPDAFPYQIVYLGDCPEHIPLLASWHHAQWSYLSPSTTLAQRIERLREHTGKRCVPTTFVALDDGKPAGSASLVNLDMSAREELSPWLAAVYVSPEYRRRGIGAVLVNRVVDEARALGIPTLYLYTPDKMRFYARLGWTIRETIEYRGQLMTVMQIDLRTADRDQPGA